ncbi:hypothetical protein ACFQ36_11115 [Arthrobacter sp. GCM10027362]|uniref:hypothetical protein n=1 Tax=Arthrobacter sp. GCM10027362 TaxID=3273379 RepID=UPI0036431F29
MARVKLGQGDRTTPKAKKNDTTGLWRAWGRFGGFDGRTVTMERTGRTKAIAEKARLEPAIAGKGPALGRRRHRGTSGCRLAGLHRTACRGG